MEFWQQRWVDNQVGWHRGQINPKLEHWWPQIGVLKAAPVLVPLAGKSLDMHWLAERGHAVVGMELSEVAVAAFFAEAGMEVTTRESGKLRCWAGQGIELYQGNFFDFTKEQLPGGDALNWYDRAALVALPPETRRSYMQHLAKLLPAGSMGLLLSFEYPQHQVAGPPFSVEQEEIRALCDGLFQCELLERELLLDPENPPSEAEQAARPNRYLEKGMTMAAETVYRLERL